MNRILSSVLATWLIMPIGAYAASKDGRYAVKEAGLQSCEVFVKESEENSSSYFLFIGWVGGYLSGYNRHTEDTVDIVPWQKIDLIIAFLKNFCDKNPEVRFATAVDRLIVELAPSRLRASADLIRVTANGKSVLIYDAILRRMQQTLAELQYYDGPIDGKYGETTRRAIEGFQKDESIPVTGLPDQTTLFQLFR